MKRDYPVQTSHVTCVVLSILTVLMGSIPTLVSARQERPRQLRQDEAKQQSGKRLALVIGNGAYASAPRLKNPPTDAADVAALLSQLGFTVEHGVDLSQRQMKGMIRNFGQKLRGSGGQGLFYFAGHGVQLRGRNYLIPIDAEIRSESDVEDQGVDVNLILGLMDEANNELNVMILDACRNNPFARSFRSSANGLAQVDAPTGMLIAYATAPGRVARDGMGRNGAYTAELLKQMRVPGLSVEELLKRVRANVKQQTNGEQIPWESSSLVGDFVLNKAGVSSQATKSQPTGATNAITNSATIEQEYWDAAKNSNDPEDYKVYLDRFPNGIYAPLARRRIQNLQGRTSPNTADTNQATNSAGQIVKSNFISFNLQQCRISGTSVLCEFVVTNEDTIDKEIQFSSGHRFLDDQGNETRSLQGQIANNKNRGFLVSGVPVRMRVVIEEVSPQATKISLLSISFYLSGGGSTGPRRRGTRFNVEYRNISLVR